VGIRLRRNGIDAERRAFECVDRIQDEIFQCHPRYFAVVSPSQLWIDGS
jgi:hypothetical protein